MPPSCAIGPRLRASSSVRVSPMVFGWKSTRMSFLGPSRGSQPTARNVSSHPNVGVAITMSIPGHPVTWTRPGSSPIWTMRSAEFLVAGEVQMRQLSDGVAESSRPGCPQ